MFYTMGMPILADELEVLTELRDQLALNGIYRFKILRPTQDHIQFNCPFHKDGQESKPSCGITTNDIKYGDGRVVKAGTVHCFTCGYVSSLEEMISRLFGKNDFGVFGANWLRKNFITAVYEKRPEIKFDLNRHKKQDVIEQEYVSEEELDTYRYIHPYMYQRKLTDEIIEKFDVGYDNDFILENNDTHKKYHIRCITFPVRDEAGRTLFIARRSVDTKLFHYPKNVVKPVYGLYELSQLESYPQEVIICESIFNCLTCWVYGKYAVALNGTGDPNQYKQLRSMPTRKFILGLDPDNAGNKGRIKLRNALSDTKIISEYIIPVGKDINDLTKEQFDNLQEVM